jgi:hypothetical protein
MAGKGDLNIAGALLPMNGPQSRYRHCDESGSGVGDARDVPVPPRNGGGRDTACCCGRECLAEFVPGARELQPDPRAEGRIPRPPDLGSIGDRLRPERGFRMSAICSSPPRRF